NVPYFGGLQAVRKEISYVPSEPASLDPCRPSLPIPTVDRPHPLSNPLASGVHKMCAGETRTVVCAGPQLDPGSPDGFDVTMIPQPSSLGGSPHRGMQSTGDQVAGSRWPFHKRSFGATKITTKKLPSRTIRILSPQPVWRCSGSSSVDADYTLGLSSLALTCCCLAALRQLLFRSPLKPETPDILIILLSLVQCFLGFIYYGFSESIGLELFIRAVKILQTLLICWLLLAGQRQMDPL
ncbi:hypothetical protein FOZ62_006918, partial [Perkinsus olseni]